MTTTIKWWQSRTIWTQIATIAVGIILVLDKTLNWNLETSQGYTLVIGILQVLGIYARAIATNKIVV
jgi:hypothetical protein